MPGWARRWLFWLAGIGLGFAAAGFVILSHQHMPGEDALIVQTGSFLPGCDGPPDDWREAEPITLPDDWRQRPVSLSCGWYRFDLDLAVAPDRLWALYVPALEMSYLVRINGVTIGSAGRFDDPLPRYWNRPVQMSIPSGLLKPGANVIDVRLHANGVWGRLYRLFLGPQAEITYYYDLRKFFRVDLLNVTTVVSLVISLFVGALTLVRRDPIYRVFAGFAAAWCLQNYYLLTVNVPVPNQWWDWIAYTLYGLMVLAGTRFTFRFLGMTRPRWERFVTVVALGGPALLAASMPLGSTTFNALGSDLWLLVIIAGACYPIGAMVLSLLRQQTLEVFALTVCYCMAFVFAISDWLVTTGLGYRHNGLLLQFAAPPMLVTFGVILMHRFIVALRETDDLNAELETRIADKSHEIELAYARARDLQQQQLLAKERERIMRDMHDGVGGQLIATLSRLDRGAPRDSVMAEELEGALRDLRMMIDSLDSVDGDVTVALGLFRNRVQQLVDASGIKLEWAVGDVPEVVDLGPERLLHFLRILQESVTNTLKHAGATQLRVVTSTDEIVDGVRCAVVVEVRDDGAGFAREAGNGRGLNNIRRRAAEANLAISITQDAGTVVRVGFPEDIGAPRDA